MKNLPKTFNQKNNAFANFQNNIITKKQQTKVKGGDDIIIMEEVVTG